MPAAGCCSYTQDNRPQTSRIRKTERRRPTSAPIGVDWSRFDVEQFRAGMDVELEHRYVW